MHSGDNENTEYRAVLVLSRYDQRIPLPEEACDVLCWRCHSRLAPLRVRPLVLAASLFTGRSASSATSCVGGFVIHYLRDEYGYRSLFVETLGTSGILISEMVTISVWKKPLFLSMRESLSSYSTAGECVLHYLRDGYGYRSLFVETLGTSGILLSEMVTISVWKQPLFRSTSANLCLRLRETANASYTICVMSFFASTVVFSYKRRAWYY